jgi:hypothetical protein
MGVAWVMRFDWRSETDWPVCCTITAPPSDPPPHRAWLEFQTRTQAEAHADRLPPNMQAVIEERQR